jgi:hypothetical protein
MIFNVLEVELLDVMLCLRVLHLNFKEGAADAHLSFYVCNENSDWSLLVAFDLERGRILQDCCLWS